MSEKLVFKKVQCPTCGANLKAKNNTDPITCVYCGNTIVPVVESTPAPSKEPASFGGVLKVEGIKTSSSAMAYIELFFEEYDWEAFAYAQTLSVSQIDKLAASLKTSFADDKNTWFVNFKSIAVPFIHKIEGCKQILASVIEEYKKDNLDAYSKFDAYKRISSIISSNKTAIVEKLEKIAAYAEKYGASADESADLKADIDKIKSLSVENFGKDISNIPEIKSFIEKKNAEIESALSAKGIDAEKEYLKAKKLIDEKSYAQALDVLLSLKGYSDSASLIEKIDKYFLIGDVLEIDDNIYYFKKSEADSYTYNLYPAKDGKISGNPIITHIKKIITNHADILYYMDSALKLKKYNLSAKTEEKIYDGKINDKDAIFVYSKRVFLLTADGSSDYSTQSKELIELELATGKVKKVLDKVESVISLTGNKLVYTTLHGDDNLVMTCIMNVDTSAVTVLGTKKMHIEGYIGNSVVYTRVSPNEYNKNLYIKSLDSQEPEKLIEPNIFRFCSIISGKLFYYVGNSRNQTLININSDGTDRREWPLYISKVLFEQGGWLYFIRKAGYNSILCKSRLDGSRFSVIAADIEEFIEIKNGYLYYVNDSNALVKVRMDGSNLQKLCDDVEKVLVVKDEKIIFVSVDDRIKTGDLTMSSTKVVKSVYAVDFTGSGKIKLAYNVERADKYDENTVYFICAHETKSEGETPAQRLETLYKLEVESNSSYKLLDLDMLAPEGNVNAFAIMMIIMAISFFVSFIGFAVSAPGLGVVCLISGVVSLIIGLAIKHSKKGD